ncbi:MAG: penicillin-binding protein 2 [Candidatus Shapirobacteria bacterium]|nr:penicillin-binding protein 2 [Candidatus Shapirobacteria bacterium]
MKQRYQILLISFLGFFLVLISRFFYWQVIKSPQLKTQALSQIYKLEKDTPTRGDIYSSDDFPFVINDYGYKISLYKPNLTQDIDIILNQLESIHPNFQKENETLLTKFKNNSQQLWIDLNTIFSLEEKNKLNNIDGVIVDLVENRYYPEKSLASNLLGFVAHNSQGQNIGYGGIEAYYNKQLQGKTGFIWSPQDATGKTILTKKSWNSNSTNGLNIYSSINRSIQYQTEKILNEGIQKYQADSGMITIMETNTGRILAMTSAVSTSSATIDPSKNPNIANLFEPGSIFKPLVVTMALDSQSIKNDYICPNCDRPLSIGAFTINNWDNTTHPNSDLKEIIKNSDNIGMSNIMSNLGLKKFLDYYQKLGLNKKTGIDLQGESKPTIKTSWPEIDIATASFGQGIVVTQINMLQAFNTIANDGVLVSPKVVDYFKNDLDQISYPKTLQNTQVFSQKSIDEIKSILKYAVNNSVVSSLKPKDIEICGKSGTAQVAVKGNYTDSATIGSYIGFAPCDKPKFTMIVTINNPKSSAWGSSTAAPIWFELAAKIYFLL